MITLPTGQSAEMGGVIYYEGDIIKTSDGDEDSDGMIITQINEETMISESKDGKYKMLWDLKRGIDTWMKHPNKYY